MVELPAVGAWPSLDGEAFISLVTFRKNGDPVPTVVWFAEVGDRLYAYTGSTSGKVKRIRHMAQVELAACDRRGRVHGPVLSGVARVLPPSETAPVEKALNRKYPAKRLFNLVRRLGRGAPAAYLEIRPAE